MFEILRYIKEDDDAIHILEKSSESWWSWHIHLLNVISYLHSLYTFWRNLFSVRIQPVKILMNHLCIEKILIV